MKKRLMFFLLIVLITTGMVCSTYAASNPLGDVPADHWAYKELDKLVKAGLIDGYNGNFNDGKTLTRYEVAQLVAKAMAKAEKADAQVQASIKKLAQEFDAELQSNFLIRTEDLEKSDNVRMVGSYIRAKWNLERMEQDDDTVYNKHPSSFIRAHLGFQGDINDNWKWTAHFRQDANWYTSGSTGSQSAFINRAFVSGDIGDFNVAVGKHAYTALDMTLFDSYYNGVRVRFGKQLKTQLLYGYHSGNAKFLYYDASNPALGGHIQSKADGIASSKTLFTGAELNYDVSKYTNLRGVYYSMEGVDLANTYDKKNSVWQIWATQKLSPDWTVDATYVKSDAKMDNYGYTARLAFKEFKISKPGSYRIAVQHRYTERFAQWNGGGYNFDIILNNVASDDRKTHNSRIEEFEVDYVPFKNAVWKTWLCNSRAADGSGLEVLNITSYIQYYF